MKNIEFYYDELKKFDLMCECYKFAFEHGMKETDLKVQSSDFISWLNEEHKILDEEEREYLSNVVKPFRSRVINIRKGMYKEYSKIIIVILSERKPYSEILELPIFKTEKMYKGMELNKKYTLLELGL